MGGFHTDPRGNRKRERRLGPPGAAPPPSAAGAVREHHLYLDGSRSGCRAGGYIIAHFCFAALHIRCGDTEKKPLKRLVRPPPFPFSAAFDVLRVEPRGASRPPRLILSARAATFMRFYVRGRTATSRAAGPSQIRVQGRWVKAGWAHNQVEGRGNCGRFVFVLSKHQQCTTACSVFCCCFFVRRDQDCTKLTPPPPGLWEPKKPKGIDACGITRRGDAPSCLEKDE